MKSISILLEDAMGNPTTIKTSWAIQALIKNIRQGVGVRRQVHQSTLQAAVEQGLVEYRRDLGWILTASGLALANSLLACVLDPSHPTHQGPCAAYQPLGRTILPTSDAQALYDRNAEGR